MRVPYLFAVRLMLSSCQNPSRIQAEHFSENCERVAVMPEMSVICAYCFTWLCGLHCASCRLSRLIQACTCSSLRPVLRSRLLLASNR